MQYNFNFNPHIERNQRELGFTGRDLDGKRGAATTAAIIRAADEGRVTIRQAATVAPVAARTAPAFPLQTSNRLFQGTARYEVNEAIVHSAATRPDWMQGQPLSAKVAEIRRWHTSAPLNWNDIGYHWVIDRDGTVAAGRAETTIGAHAGAVKNRGTIGICLLGGHGSSENHRFSQHFTAAQDQALRQLLISLANRAVIRKISGHNEYAAKACPGFMVRPWWAAAA